MIGCSSFICGGRDSDNGGGDCGGGGVGAGVDGAVGMDRYGGSSSGEWNINLISRTHSINRVSSTFKSLAQHSQAQRFRFRTTEHLPRTWERLNHITCR